MDFEIIPYVGALPLMFRSLRAEVEDVLGEPQFYERTDYPPRMNLSPVIEVRYDELKINLAYDLEDKLTYICFSCEEGGFPGTVIYNDIDLFRDDDALSKLVSLEGRAFEWVGFVVLLDLGMRLSGFHIPAESGLVVSLFEKGRYDKRMNRFRPFHLTQ